MPRSSRLIGRVIGGRYRIDVLIGEGGFGLVYRGTHLALGTPVAIKITTEERPDLLARFRQEARAQDRINSRFVVRLRDFGREPDGLHYLVQNFVPGRSLEEIVDHDGPLAPERAVRLMRQLCHALEEAHLRGIIHRDVKPSNIMVVDTPRSEEVRLLDFGIAKMLDEGSKELGLTRTGQIHGTVAYMAPEQLQGKRPVAATDVYAVGGTLYTLLTGAFPYRGSLKSVAMQHLVAPLPELPPGCPAVVQPVIQRAMAKEPGDRYATSDAMGRALAELLPRVAGLPALEDGETEVRERAFDGLEDLEELDSALLVPIDESHTWDPAHRARLSALSHHLRGQLDAARTEALGPARPSLRLVAGVIAAVAIGVALALLGSWLPGSRADPVPTVVRAATSAGPEAGAEPSAVVARPEPITPAEPRDPVAAPTDPPPAPDRQVDGVDRGAEPVEPARAPSAPTPKTAPAAPPRREVARAAEETGAAPARANGVLKLLAKPPARASIRGKSLGWTPILGHALPPGTYTVDLVRTEPPEYRSQVQVTIKPDQTTFERYTHR